MALRGTPQGIAATAVGITVAVPAPAGLASGDIVLLFAHAGGGGTDVFSSPGFLPVPALSMLDVNPGVDSTCGCLWKVAGASEPSIYNLSTSVSDYLTGQCRAYSGRAPMPFRSMQPTGSTPFVPPASPSITGVVPVAGDDIVTFIGLGSTSVAAKTWTVTPPTGFANLRTDIGAQTWAPGCSSFDYVNNPGGATGILRGTLALSPSSAAENYAAMTIALAPLGASGMPTLCIQAAGQPVAAGAAHSSPMVAPTIGNVIVAIMYSGVDSQSITACSDTAGNVYAKIVECAGGNGMVSMWAAPVTASVANNQVTLSPLTTAGRVSVAEFHGIQAVVDNIGTLALDASTGTTINNGGANSGSNDLVITAVTLNTAAANVAVPGWLPMDFSCAGQTGPGAAGAYYKTDAGSGATDAATWTWASASGNIGFVIASFKGAVAVGTEQILLDDPAAVGGSSNLYLGAALDDGTGDQLRAGGGKLKAWAAALNIMLAKIFSLTTFMGDANRVLTAANSGAVIYCNTTLTANRTVTLPSTGLKDGMTFKIVRRATTPGAFTLTIVDPVSGKSEVIAANTNGFSHWRAVSAAEWICMAHGTYT